MAAVRARAEQGGQRHQHRGRLGLHAALLHAPGGEAVHCTVTVGVSETFCDDGSLARAMQTADAALYRGKHAGRDRVERVAPEMEALAPAS